MAHHEQVKRHHDGPQVLHAHERHDPHGSAAGEREKAGNGHGAAHAKAQQQAAAGQGAHDVAERHRHHHQAVAGFAESQHLDEHKRRRGQEGEQAAVRRGGQQRKRNKSGVPRNLRPGAQQRQRLQGAWVFLLQGFFKAPHQQRQRDRAKHRQRQQRGAPAKQVGQQAAQRRTGAGDHAQAGEPFGHDAGAFGGGVQVAHDGPRAHDARAHGHALQRTPGNQVFHGRRKAAADGRHHKRAHAQQQNGAATKAVRQRAPHQLRQAKRQQQGGQGELGLRHRRAKSGGQGGQGGQVQIGGNRLQTQQQRQRENDEARGHRGRLGRHLVEVSRSALGGRAARSATPNA